MKNKSSAFFAFFVTFFSSLPAESLLSTQTLDDYLHQYGYYLSPNTSAINEGYSIAAQREKLVQILKDSPHFRSIAEIGFNAGHSCEAFLKNSDTIKVTSFDIGCHAYTPIGVEFMRKKYPNRFEFVLGDSKSTVPAYARSTSKKFDFIFIDGSHEYEDAVADIRNCRMLAHKNTLACMDDPYIESVQAAINLCAHAGLIEVIDSSSIADSTGWRSWCTFKYVQTLP